MAMAGITRAYIDEMKRTWEADPCYDLPCDHPCFAEYADELRQFRDACRARWEAAENHRIDGVCQRYGVPFNAAFARAILTLEERVKTLEKKVGSLAWGRDV